MQNATIRAVASPENRTSLDWSGQKFDAFGSRPIVAHHGLNERDVLNDEVLVDILDRYPRNRLQAWTMGTDPLRREDWQPVDTADVSGKDLLAAVKSGRLWYNILRLDLFDPMYRDIVDQLYAEMARACPQLKPLSVVGTLLLSSPGAQVYYHADGPPTTLFHIRGRKRMWVYPACDERFISQEMMEAIFGSAMDEEVPYSPEFDRYADVFDLKPGDMVWWPLNAPHRIENLDSFNVSLSTRYHTVESERRKLVYNANRFFRRLPGIKHLSVKETGLNSRLKCLAFRACRRAGLEGATSGYVYQAKFRVDPNGPLGMSALTEPRKPAFSR
jgi:hypothetical protein